MKTKAYLFIVLASVMWGTSGLFVNFLAPYGLTSLQMTAIRAMGAAIFMGIYIFVSNKRLFRVSAEQLVLYALGGISMFCTQSCYFTSMQMTSVSTAVVLMFTAPIFVMIYSVAFLGEKLTPQKTVSLVLMIVGCALVSGIVGGLKVNIIGILLGLLSGIAYSAYNILTKIQMRKTLNPSTATFYCFLTSGMLAMVFSKPQGIVTVAMENPHTILLMAGLSAVTCFLPYFIYTIALKTIPAGTATTLGILEPMAATIFSVVILGERLSIASTTGIVLILFAVFLLSKSKEE
ncbi:MAG: EamA family transporter [Clostridia bacterium]|nr:EamA family transporter [Clostridia bacterium]